MIHMVIQAVGEITCLLILAVVVFSILWRFL